LVRDDRVKHLDWGTLSADNMSAYRVMPKLLPYVALPGVSQGKGFDRQRKTVLAAYGNQRFGGSARCTN